MKKFLSFGVFAIAITAVFSGCSKSTDLYDEAAVEKQQQEQKVAELKKAYNNAFTKAFGAIDPNNAWGFDKTRGAFTREASNVETSEYWIIPENLYNGTTNKEGVAANDVANGFKNGVSQSYTIDNFSFDNYFIQHVDKYKPASCYLQAWNSNGEGSWETVTNFADGDNPNGSFSSSNFYFKNNPNSVAQITTLMKNMGGQPCDKADENGSEASKGKLFRLVKTENNKTTYDYNYYLTWLNNKHKKPNKWFNEPVLVFQLGELKNNPGKGNNPFWVMRLGVAQNTNERVMAEGRILCEDMGANDFDFNDVVFDAKIMGNGEIRITVQAHGGMLPISIDGQEVTLPTMSNTGLAEADPQEIIIPAKAGGEPKYKDINDIPIQVVPNGNAQNAYDLTAEKGAAPQKVCVPIGIAWPDEYVGISRAYSPFSEYVNIHTMDDWMFTVNPDLVDGDMSNNN